MKEERYICNGRTLVITEQNGILTCNFIKNNETDIYNKAARGGRHKRKK